MPLIQAFLMHLNWSGVKPYDYDTIVTVKGFFLGKDRKIKSARKSTAKLKSEFESFAAKIHTARIWP